MSDLKQPFTVTAKRRATQTAEFVVYAHSEKEARDCALERLGDAEYTGLSHGAPTLKITAGLNTGVWKS